VIYDRKFYGPNQSLRYCMNSVSLHFIPLNLLEQNGYGEYLKLFNL
jgi:peptide-methionine (R)-S-oxide reductase